MPHPPTLLSSILCSKTLGMGYMEYPRSGHTGIVSRAAVSTAHFWPEVHLHVIIWFRSISTPCCLQWVPIQGCYAGVFKCSSSYFYYSHPCPALLCHDVTMSCNSVVWQGTSAVVTLKSTVGHLGWRLCPGTLECSHPGSAA